MKLRNSFCIVFLAILLLSSGSLRAVECSAGGPGASSCSATVKTLAGSTTFSVKCVQGYYACCNALTGAKCKKMPKAGN